MARRHDSEYISCIQTSVGNEFQLNCSNAYFITMKGLWSWYCYLLNSLEDFLVYKIVRCRCILTVFSSDQNFYAAVVCDPR